MEKKITLELTIAETNLILAGLGELPAKSSMELISKIMQSSNEQLKEGV